MCSMVDSGQMYAYMDEARGVVEFPEEADHYCSPETAQRLHEQLQQASTISKKLAKLDFEVRPPRNACLVAVLPATMLVCCQCQRADDGKARGMSRRQKRRRAHVSNLGAHVGMCVLSGVRQPQYADI